MSNTHAQSDRARVFTFLPETRAAVGKVQDVLRIFIESLPTRCERANELARTLGLDSSSVWRIWQVAYAPTLEEAASSISGDAALGRFVAAMIRCGADSQHAQAIPSLMQEFGRAVETEVGDMNALRIMLAGDAGTSSEDSRFVRGQFDAWRLRMGCEVDSCLRIMARVPSQFQDLVDLVSFSQYNGFRALLPERSHVVRVRRFFETAHYKKSLDESVFTCEEVGQTNQDGLEHLPEGGAMSSMILEASSPNGWKLWKRNLNASSQYTFASGGRIGKAGEAILSFGDIMRAYGPSFIHATYWAAGHECSAPTKEIVFELYVSDQEVEQGLIPEARQFDSLYGDQPGFGREIIQKEPGSLVEHFPPGRGRPIPSQFPRYQSLLDVMQKKSNFRAENMHLFRMRIDYPAVGVMYCFFTDYRHEKE